MPKFKVLKHYTRKDGVFYDPNHAVDLELPNISKMPDDLLEVFDEVFQPEDVLAEAFRESVVETVMDKRGIE